MNLERKPLLFIQRLVSKNWLWPVLLTLVLLALRLYYWWVVGPSSLNQDEAALLLNARFLAEAGRDEWGSWWPVVFQSFGDAKLPGYIYTVAGLGKLIGFSDWTVRIPAFVAGLALPFLVYINAQQWTRSKTIALVSTLLFVISPWSWHYGTVGFEANLGLTLFLMGTYWVFRKTSTVRTDIVGVFFFLLAALTYNTPWILLPVVGVSLCIVRWAEWRNILRVGVLLLGVFVGVWMLTASATMQKGAITIFQDPTLIQAYPEFRQQFSGVWQTVFGNQYVYFAQLATERWLQSWSWEFLVTAGGQNPWHSIPGVGHLHTVIPGFAVVGGVVLVVQMVREKSYKYGGILLWLLTMSLLPSILTVDAPHATRSLFFFVMITVLAGSGLSVLYDGLCKQLGTKSWWPFLRFGFVLFFVWGFAWWWVPAKIRWERMLSPKWNAGFVTVLQNPQVKNAQNVFIWDPSGNRYPYVALQENMSFQVFLDEIKRSQPDTVGLVRVEKLGKYQFVFERSHVELNSGDVYLEPNGNTSWDIVEW